MRIKPVFRGEDGLFYAKLHLMLHANALTEMAEKRSGLSQKFLDKYEPTTYLYKITKLLDI